MKWLFYLLSAALLVSQVALADDKRVLMLISSNGSAANPELSYDLEELALRVRERADAVGLGGGGGDRRGFHGEATVKDRPHGNAV
mgnify:CR=1 FL=1